MSNYRKGSKLFALLLLLGLLWLPTACGLLFADEEPDDVGEATVERTISVTGTGQVTVQPQVAVVVLSVRTDAATPADALSQNSQQMQSLINALRSADIAGEDLRTQTVQLYPRYEQAPPRIAPETTQGGQLQVVGYTATNTLEVRVRNLSRLGQILESAVQAGGNVIEGVRFEIGNSSDSNAPAAYDQARERAWQDARNKAAQLANLANASLGPVAKIQEIVGETPSPLRQAVGGQEGVVPPIEPGVQTLSITLQVTWFLR